MRLFVRRLNQYLRCPEYAYEYWHGQCPVQSHTLKRLIMPLFSIPKVEPRGIEPLTSSLRTYALSQLSYGWD